MEGSWFANQIVSFQDFDNENRNRDLKKLKLILESSVNVESLALVETVSLIHFLLASNTLYRVFHNFL